MAQTTTAALSAKPRLKHLCVKKSLMCVVLSLTSRKFATFVSSASATAAYAGCLADSTALLAGAALLMLAAIPALARQL